MLTMHNDDMQATEWRETSVQALFDLSDNDMAAIERMVQDAIERSRRANKSTEESNVRKSRSADRV